VRKYFILLVVSASCSLCFDLCLLAELLRKIVGRFSWHLLNRPKRIWREVVEKDCQSRKLNKEDAVDCSRWRKLMKDVWWSGWVWVGEGFFWYRPTWAVPDKGSLFLKRLCVFVVEQVDYGPRKEWIKCTKWFRTYSGYQLNTRTTTAKRFE